MKIIYPCLIFPALIISCSGNKNDSGFSTSEKITLTEAVCIMDEIPIYEESRINSPIVSSAQLGEIVQLVNPQTSIQEPDPGKLYKVRLPEGSNAWISGAGILTQVKPAAILKETAIYTDTGAGTPTGKSFKQAEYAVVTSENDAWVKLTGAGKRKIGWVKKEMISTDPSDIHVAILAHSYLLEKNGNLMTDKLPDFIRQLPDKNTKLALELQKTMDKEVGDLIEQSIMEYEHEYPDGNFDTED